MCDSPTRRRLSLALLALLTLSFLAPSLRADDRAKKIRAALKKLEHSLVKVRYTFDVTKSRVNFHFEDASGGSREKKNEKVCLGLVTDINGTVLISGNVFPDPHSRSMAFGGAFMGKATSPPKAFFVEGPDGESLPAQLVTYDEGLNVAFIKVATPPSSWKPVPFDYKAKLHLADPILAVHFLSAKYKYQFSFSVGRLTGRIEGDIPRWLQTALAPEFRGRVTTGAPIISLDTGNIVGIVTPQREVPKSEVSSTGLTEKTASTGVFVSVGGPSETPHLLMASALEEAVKDPVAGLGERGWIGLMRAQPMDRDLARFLDRSKGSGAIINLVARQSPGEAAGLRPGDLLVAVDGKKIKVSNQAAVNSLLRRIRRRLPGDEIVLSILRDEEETELHVKVARAPKNIYGAKVVVNEKLGVTFAEITQDVIEQKNLDLADLGKMIVRRVPMSGFFAEAGLLMDDIILGINDHEVDGIESLEKALTALDQETESEALVKIRRGASTRFLKVEIE